jgi:MFS family permease
MTRHDGPYPPSARQPSVKATLAASYAFAVVMLGVTLPTPLYPLYQHALGFSTLVTTAIYAAYSAVVMITLVLFGGGSDHYGRRPVLLAGLACSAASAACFAAKIGLPEIFTGRILSGLSAGLFTGTATAYVIELAPRARRGQATLLAAAANIGGIGAGPLLAGLTSQYLPAPLRTAYGVDLALVAIGILLLARLPETATSLDHRLGLRPRLGIPKPARVMFARAAIAGGAGYAMIGYFLAVIPSTLQTQFTQHNHAVTGVVICLLFAASLAGQIAVPALGNERALAAGCLVLIAGMGLLAAALAESSLGLLTAGAVIAGAGQGLSFRGGLALVRALSPQQQAGRVASTFFVVLYAAISTAVIGIGIAAETFGLRRTGIATAVIVAALAAICAGSLAVLRE